MLWYAISLAFRGLSTYRWNSFPRVEQVTTTDSIAFSLHVATIVAGLYEEKTGYKVDLGYIYRRALFSSFVTFVHSDISNDVKSRLRAKRGDLYEKFHQSTLERLLKWELPAFFSNDLTKYWNPHSGKETEERIFKFSKNWVAYQEASVNDSVYLHAFDSPLATMRERCLEEYPEFLEYLKLDASEHSQNEKFLLSVRRLQSSFRWNRMRRQYPVSVMSHLFFIFFLSYLIGNVEEKSQDEITDMMKTALYHDIPEAITGDIITPTKKSVAGFEELIAEVEVEMLDEYLLDFIRERSFFADLRKRMLEPWSCKNGDLVKLADVFSALFEAKIEGSVSHEFAEVYRRVRRDLHKKFGRPSVDFLFRNGVDPFEENLEEILK